MKVTMTTWLAIFVAAVALGGLFLGLWFWSRKKAPDTSFLLLQQQLDAIRDQLRQTLEGNASRMDTRLDNAAKVFMNLETRMVKIEEVTRQVLEVGKDISTLQQILKAPKLRGNFSEQLLSDLLSQMMPQDNFELQYTFRSGERVDAVIKTAQGLVSIDAKFPLENFQRLVLCDNEDEKKALRKSFISDVKKHVDDIASKYILPAEGTFEFALMYIPAENVYYEIITRDLASGENASIVYYAMKKKVIPVSPNTFYAYLQTILLGLRGMQVEKRVKEVLTEMSRLKKDLDGFRGDFGKLGKHLSDALSSFEKSDKRLSRFEGRLTTLEITPQVEVLEEGKESHPEAIVSPPS